MILLGKGTVVTRNPLQPIIEDGGVLMDGTKIVAVDSYETLRKQYPKAYRVNAHGRVIMPGFVNAHHHASDALRAYHIFLGYLLDL